MTRLKVTRYDKNPFLDMEVIQVRKKRVTIGNGDNVLIDQATGEIKSTNVVAYREVDDAQFVKLFTQNISLMLELTAAGNKALGFLFWSVQNGGISRDLVPLGIYEMEQFLEFNSSIKMSEATMRRGLAELVKAKIIAHSKKLGVYFINPNFMFNGDRVRFITEIRRKSTYQKQQERLEKAGQQRLYD